MNIFHHKNNVKMFKEISTLLNYFYDYILPDTYW